MWWVDHTIMNTLALHYKSKIVHDDSGCDMRVKENYHDLKTFLDRMWSHCSDENKAFLLEWEKNYIPKCFHEEVYGKD